MELKDNFLRELEELIKKYSIENKTWTPDFILANYVKDSLDTFKTAIKTRDEWYDFDSCIKPTKGIGG